MATRPRGYFTMEQRDSVLMEMHDTLIEVKGDIKALVEKNEVCVDRIDTGEKRLDDFQKNIAAAGVAVLIALIGVVAVLL